MSELGRAQVDRELCFSYGRCIDASPQLFSFSDDDGKSTSSDGLAPVDLLLEVARDCPMQAISVVDEAGRTLTP